MWKEGLRERERGEQMSISCYIKMFSDQYKRTFWVKVIELLCKNNYNIQKYSLTNHQEKLNWGEKKNNTVE